MHLPVRHREPLCGEGAAQHARIGLQALHALRAALEQLQGSLRPRHGRRGGGGREDQRASAVDQVAHHLGVGAHVGAVGTERLAERAHDGVDLTLQPRLGNSSAAAWPKRAGGVRLIHRHARPARLRHFHQLLQWRHIAVHGEHRIGHDQLLGQAIAARAVAADAPFQVLDVRVPVDDYLSAGEAASVDDRGVVELIGEDRVAAPGERADDAEVCQVARSEQHAGLASLEGG